MLKKILSIILVAIALFAVTYILFSKKEPENVRSNPMISENETCKEGYTAISIVMPEGDSSYCVLTSSIPEGPRLIGTGKETYTLTGYYYEYEQEYYPFDYDDHNLPLPTRECHGFVVMSGNRDFIDAYKTQINRLEKNSNNIIINLDHMSIVNPPVLILASTSPLATKIIESSPAKPIDLDFMVRPFPERDVNPCDSHGIYIVVK